MEVVYHENKRSGISQRILVDLPRDLFVDDTWLGRKHLKHSQKASRTRRNNLNQLSWGDVHELVFEFTIYADGIPGSYPIIRGSPRRPMTLPLLIRSGHNEQTRNRITSGPSRYIYITQVCKKAGDVPIRTEKEMEEAVKWVARLPNEAIGRWQRHRVRRCLTVLRGSTHKQRVMNLKMLKAFRALNKAGTRFSCRALAKEMMISPDLFAYHKKTNNLLNACLKLQMAICDKRISKKAALDDGLRISRDTSHSAKPRESAVDAEKQEGE